MRKPADKATPPTGGSQSGKDSRGPRNCASCPVRNEQHKLICQLVKEVGAKLKAAKEPKASVSDYIRLLQLQKDMEEGQPREIQVTWVEEI